MMATAPSRGIPEDSQEKQPEAPSFEQAIGRLEEIVHSLEEGKLGLDEALGRYEEGVGLLRRAYELLETAQRRISLLSGVDSEGNPILRPMEDAASFTP
jgi:exodeoxyribonuclease VII small subunit